MVEQLDVVLRVQARIVLRGERREAVDAGELVRGIAGRRVGHAGDVVHLRAREHAEARIDVVGPEADVGVVAGDRVGARAAVDPVVAVERAGDVAPADQDVVAVTAVERVLALLAHEQVVAGLAVDRVVPRAGEGERVRRHEFEEAVSRIACREQVPADRRQAGDRIDRVVVLALDHALVAEDEVAAASGVDHVGARAAEDIVLVAADDRVDAASLKSRRSSFRSCR